LLRQISVVVLSCGLLIAQTSRPERHVEGNVIASVHDPTVRIQLPKSARYAGADRWILYGIADCELHAFADVDAHNNVQQLYWVQFEGYLPTKPELKHTYDSQQHARIGGMDFYVDTWVRSRDASIEPGSDREHIEQLIRAKGYKMPEGMMYVRLVHLLDEQKRKELMIIYGEDLASTGHTAAELQDGGKAHEQWPALQKGLIDRAQEKVTLRELDKPDPAPNEAPVNRAILFLIHC
jgi:hypothetical protein